MDDIENALFGGERIGDMDRENLLRVISALFTELQASRAAHGRSLEVWAMAQQARSIKGQFGFRTS